MKFRLRNEKGRVAGNHIETVDGKDVVYKAGDTIHSEKELDKIFPGKFERISIREDFADGSPNIMDKRFDSEEDEAKALQARLDEIKSDSGVDSEDSKEDTPDDDDSEENDDDEDDDSEEEDEDEEIDPATLGEDVTDRFPKAKDLGVQIYLSGKSWYVAYDPDDKVLLNEDGKKIHKKQMTELLDSYDDED